MIEFETEVLDVIKRTPTVKSFRFKVGEQTAFKAGQFFFVTIKMGEEKRTKHFSFSNSPTEKDYIEFTKRITESPFSKTLNGLKTGDWAHLKLPYGSFTFEGEYEKIAFLSGGIGITSIRSICKYVADMKLPVDIVLLYSNRDEKEITFRRDLDNMQAANKNIRIVYTLTSPDTGKHLWKGRMGRIDSEMVRKEIPDFDQRVFYICGPPKMVEVLSGILMKDLNIPRDKIKLENFSGY